MHSSREREVGISFLPDNNYLEVQRIARELADHPFDVISSYEDLGYPSPMLQLFSFVQYSSNARIGPACLVVPKYNTMESVLAQMTLLNSVRQNKVFLGLAPGAWMQQIALRAASVEKMEEAVNSFVYLLNRQVDGFVGHHFSIEPGFVANHTLSANTPIMIGAWGENMLEMAGANLFVTEVKGGGSANPQMVNLIRQRVSKGTTKVKRESDEVGIVLGAVTVVDRDRNQALLAAKKRAAMYIDVIGDKDPFAMDQFSTYIIQVKECMAEGKLADAVAAIPDDLAKMFVFAGTPDDVIEQALPIYRSGAKRIEFGSPHGVDHLEGVELLAREVLPVLHLELD